MPRKLYAKFIFGAHIGLVEWVQHFESLRRDHMTFDGVLN